MADTPSLHTIRKPNRSVQQTFATFLNAVRSRPELPEGWTAGPGRGVAGGADDHELTRWAETHWADTKLDG